MKHVRLQKMKMSGPVIRGLFPHLLGLSNLNMAAAWQTGKSTVDRAGEVTICTHPWLTTSLSQSLSSIFHRHVFSFLSMLNGYKEPHPD